MYAGIYIYISNIIYHTLYVGPEKGTTVLSSNISPYRLAPEGWCSTSRTCRFSPARSARRKGDSHGWNLSQPPRMELTNY